MTIIQITPGAGGMFCGNCIRDNALVRAWRDAGHAVTMVPLYLPMRLDETDQSEGTPIFFGGINVYLQEKSNLFRSAPEWLHELLASPKLLKWAAGRTAKTRAADLGGLTVSMLKGEDGNQARELEKLTGWLETQPRPDIICLSNALLLGFVRRLKAALNVPVVCCLQGEDAFLDALPPGARAQAHDVMAERARDVDLFIAPSNYFGQRMAQRLRLSPEQVQVVFNGINVEGYSAPATAPETPVVGFFARMCREKGLDILVDAFIHLRKRGLVPARLAVGGSCGPSDEPLVAELKKRLRESGLEKDALFFPNLTRDQKIQFYQGLSVLSVPVPYGEAFGLYIIEALASGVPVVQPRLGAFPELIDATEGGLLYEPNSAKVLSERLEELLRNPVLRGTLGSHGRQSVLRDFTIQRFAENLLAAFKPLLLLILLLMPGLGFCDEIDDYVQSQMKESSIPGLALAVLQSSNTVKTSAYGYSNLELKVPVTAETVFEIGSITKQFTAALILELAEEGKLSVDDEISKHLDDTPEAWRGITLRHLLTHTSGVRNYTGLDGFEVRRKLDGAAFIRTLREYELDFKPGHKFAYCNSGYNLLGYVIENHSGTNYWHVLRNKILNPLNMEKTTARDAKPIIKHRASGYELEKGEWVNRDNDLTDVFAAGAMVSTVGDVAKWEMALQRAEILSATNRSLAWSPVKLNNGETYPYGFGWRLDGFEGRRCIGHSGSTSGFSASLQRFPDDKGLAVIVLCNLGQQGLATQIARGIARIKLRS